MRNRVTLIAVILAVLLTGDLVRADDRVQTTITLKELDCPSCAKKLATRLKEVPGVAEVKTSVETKTAVITPRPREAPSPRAMWETVEKAGFEPVKLKGPSGTFSDKPKS